jgi:hypothetical protein
MSSPISVDGKQIVIIADARWPVIRLHALHRPCVLA